MMGRDQKSHEYEKDNILDTIEQPLLFIFYVADAPSPPPDTTIKSYADNFTSIKFGTNISEMAGKQTNYLKDLVQFFEDRNLKISIDKSFVTLITPQTAQFKTDRDVQINNTKIKMKNQAKTLRHDAQLWTELQRNSAKMLSRKRPEGALKHRLGSVQRNATHDIQSRSEIENRVRRTCDHTHSLRQ